MTAGYVNLQLTEQFVIVIDIAPYYDVADMATWINGRNIHFHPNILKPQLYKIIKRHKKQ